MAGCIIAAPFILYQVWLFISPGALQKRKTLRNPLHDRHGELFLAGAFFGYHWVFPGSLDFLFTFNKDFNPLIARSTNTQTCS